MSGSDDDALFASFADPDPSFGPVPLWWWDGDEYDRDRLTDQLEALAAGNVTGVCFIQKHPTGYAGDRHDYFSEEWWTAMEHVAHECDRLGMELWVHDETYHHSPPNHRKYWQHWIAGEAGANPEYRGEALRRADTAVAPGETATLEFDFRPLDVRAYPVEERSLRPEGAVALGDESGEGAVTWTAPGTGADEWRLIAVGREEAGLCYTRPDVVERYIDLHYAEYERRLGDLLGDVVAGTFEDELLLLQPEFPHDHTINVPAGDHVLERFREEKGYDPVPRLAALYEDAHPEATAFRTDYYDVVVTLLEENWFEPLYEWHDERGMLKAHDNFGRNDLTDQTVQYGDYYRTMRWYQAPGYDDGDIQVGENRPIGERNFFDAKLSASIAECYDRERVWGELFHSTGWGFRPEKQLAGLVENVCYGMDIYDKHGLYYSTTGGWWEHAPPDVHFRQPYWDDVGDIGAVAARLGALFGRGDLVADVAMLYPATSMHADWRPDRGVGEAGERVDEATRDVAERLYRSGTDLVFVDHETLAGADAGGGTLDVTGAGVGARALVLGPTTTLRRETVDAVRAFYESGGVVLAAGGLPTATAEGGADDDYLTGALTDVFGDAARPGQVAGYAVSENDAGGVAVVAPADADLTGLLDGHLSRDVLAPPDVYHSHRRVEGRDVYLLFNTRDEARSVEVSLRADGRPERWDARTGERDPVRGYERSGEYTTVDLSLDPHGFRVLVFDESGPDAVETSLADVDAVRATGDGYELAGVADTGGAQTARVVDGDATYEGAVDDVTVPETLALDGPWELEPAPVLDNEYGDFRYPPGDEVLGPEVRSFAHRVERPGGDGRAAGWHRPGAADDWDEVEWSTGHRFWIAAVEDGDPPAHTPDESTTEWEPYAFSRLTGTPGTHPNLGGFTAAVSDEFLVAPEECDAAYVWTTVTSETAREVVCHYGPGVTALHVGERQLVGGTAIPPAGAGAGGWVGPDSEGAADPASVTISLPAGETPVLMAVEPGTRTHLAFEPAPGEARDRDMTYVPRVRWFHDTDALAFDPKPWEDDPVNWYQFDVPPGTSGFTLPARGSVRAWVEGTERDVVDGRVDLDAPLAERSTVAVRAAETGGAYGGAVFEAPVELTTDPVAARLGDWRDLGFADYSGRVRYRRTVTLPEFDDGDEVVLDLGEVAVSASVTVNGTRVGSQFDHPYRFDVSGAAEPGENVVEVAVANTLANHLAGEVPTMYVYDNLDQRRSGLFGPVTVAVRRGVTLSLDEE